MITEEYLLIKYVPGYHIVGVFPYRLLSCWFFSASANFEGSQSASNKQPLSANLNHKQARAGCFMKWKMCSKWKKSQANKIKLFRRKEPARRIAIGWNGWLPGCLADWLDWLVSWLNRLPVFGCDWGLRLILKFMSKRLLNRHAE